MFLKRLEHFGRFLEITAGDNDLRVTGLPVGKGGGDDGALLEDLAADPGEKNNLLEKSPAERQRLEALLAKWEADVDAPPFDLSDPAGDIGEPNNKEPVEPQSDATDGS